MKSRTRTQNHTNAAPKSIIGGKGSFRGALTLLATFVTILSIIGLSSCSGYTSAANQTLTPSTGTLTPSATTLSFGSVAMGSAALQSISVTNTGTATVNIATATISGAGFTFIGGNPTAAIPVGQSSTVQIQFAPTATGAVTGAITVTSDATNSPLTVSITGTGTQSALAIAPVSVSFGNVTVGQSSSQTVKLTNTGSSSLTINPATVSGAPFTMSGFSLPAVIAAGQSTTFSVQFTPTAAGSATGTVAFTDNGPSSPQTLVLVGMGVVPGANLTATPGSIAFGNVVMGSNNSQSITLKNSGNVTLTFSQVSVTGGPGFTVSGISTSTTIAAGSSMSFNAIFAPGSLTPVSGSVALTTNGSPAVLTIPLTGAGATASVQLGSNPTSLSFGEVNTNTSSSLTSTLTNTGNSNVTITGVTTAGTGITASGVATGLVLQPNQTATLTVKYAPTAIGTLTGASVSITSNAAKLTISLTGTAVQHSVSLNWTDSTTPGVTGYYVYRSTTFGLGYAKLNPGTPVSASTPQYTDPTVQAALTYYYVVTSVDSSGVESADSNQSTAVIP